MTSMRDYMDGENIKPPSESEREERNLVVLTWRTRLCYGAGHVLNDLCANVWFSYLLVYMQYVVGLSPVTAGSLLLIGQVADALSTPVVGIESDRTGYYKYGRRKLWHLLGITCVSLSFPFIFVKCLGCEHSSRYALVIYYVPFIVVFQFGWAATQISHLALIPELSECKIEKVTLNAIR
jgi:Na+/melibiose symporter-like transporter